jgi:hypothetical protein
MTTVEVKSTISVKLGAHVFDMTRAEAKQLFDALKAELEPNPYQSILHHNNLNRTILGPIIGYGAVPAKVPDNAPFEGTITC